MRRRALTYKTSSGFAALPLGNITHQYDFDGDSTDAVGTKDGTDTGVTYVAGVGDNLAVDFDGSSSYVTFPTGLSDTGATGVFSVSCMVKADNTTDAMRILTFDAPNDGLIWFRLNSAGTSDRLTVNLRASPDWISHHETSAGVTSWNHIITTIDKDDDEVNIYLNGVLKHTDTLTGNLINYGTNVNRIGAGRIANNQADGQMAALKIWDVVLTSDEASSLATQELAGTKVN